MWIYIYSGFDIMIENKIGYFIKQASRYAGAGLMLCSSGNLSWRIGEKALVSGTGTWLSALTEGKVALCDVATGVPENGVRPSMESVFHLGVMRERADVNVVLHFQSEYATVVACMKEKPKNFNVTLEVPYHVGKIAVIPYYCPGSPELAQAVIEAMREHDAVLMSNHGQVVCGKDFDDVLQRALFFEMACRIIVQSGGAYNVLGERDVEDLKRLRFNSR